MSKVQYIEVTITKDGRGRFARSSDGINFSINDIRNSKCRVGDVWKANAVGGRRKGQKGRTAVALVELIRPGFFTELDDHWVEPSTLEMIQTFMDSGIHSLLTGPPGSGKTLLPQRLAVAKGLTFLNFPCAQVLFSKDFFGSDTVFNGTTRFIRSILMDWLEAAQEDEADGVTHLLCLDEINRVQGRASNALLDLLGPNRRTSLPTIEGTLEIYLPNNVAVIATANLGREYSGTFPLDQALEDRFSPIGITQAPEAEMCKLLAPKHILVKPATLRLIVQAAWVMRELYDKRPTLRVPPSYRGIEAALALATRGWNVNDCVERTFMERMGLEERNTFWSALNSKNATFRAPSDAPDVP